MAQPTPPGSDAVPQTNPNTEISRVEVGQRNDGTTYSRVVEVPVTRAEDFGWQNVAEGISTGAWAVLLFMGVIAWRYSGTVGKYVDKQMSLLETMKESLKSHSESLAKLSEAERIQSTVLSAMAQHDSKVLDEIKGIRAAMPRKTNRVLAAIDELKALHNESHVALETISPKYHRAKEQERMRYLEEDEES